MHLFVYQKPEIMVWYPLQPVWTGGGGGGGIVDGSNKHASIVYSVLLIMYFINFI